MDTTRLSVPASVRGGRFKQVHEAKQMEQAIEERAKRMGNTAPPFEFLELTGKGAFGRVFKCRRRNTSDIVAVKIIDIDSSDYKLDAESKDEAIKDFVNEISVLNQLKGSKAQNINTIHDAFCFHSQLWIVSDYCPGGSVQTLMKASVKPGLEEKYIIAISRELAVAMKHVHDNDIIHRDIKASNVLITEDGQLQLCDFGVSGVLESNVAKRSTIIGTPFWMPPEMHESIAMPGDLPTEYGFEVDCWAFGCTVYELATGLPPNARIAPERLALFLKKAPRLEGDDYSADLREFIAFCLQEDPRQRPNASQILRHPFIANTQRKYPTTILKELIHRYAMWEQTGGIRNSLFAAHGAAGPGRIDEDESDEWNFSTTENFDTMMFSNIQTPVTAHFDGGSRDVTPKPAQAPKSRLEELDEALKEARVQRAGAKMGRIFDEYGKAYNARDSDLPLRSLNADQGTVRESVIDLDAALDTDETPNLDLADVPTIRAKQSRFNFDDDEDLPDSDDEEARYLEQTRNLTKRQTRDWKFPSSAMTMPAVPPETQRPRTQDWTFPKLAAAPNSDTDVLLSAEPNEENDAVSPLISDPLVGHIAPQFRPGLARTATEPIAPTTMTMPANLSSSPDRDSIIDLDAAVVSSFTHIPSRPSTAQSADDGMTPFSSFAASSGPDPFSYSGSPATSFQIATPETDLVSSSDMPQRQSMHMHSQSEPNRHSAAVAADDFAQGYLTHNRGSSLESDRLQNTKQTLDHLHDADANEADTEETVQTETEDGYGSGFDTYSRRRHQQRVWDDLKQVRHAPQRSLSFKDRLKPGSTLFRKGSADVTVKRAPTAADSLRLNGSLRTARRTPSALTQRNVERQPLSENTYQTQRWLGSVQTGKTEQAEQEHLPPISRSQSFATEESTADDSDAFFVGSLRSKRPTRSRLHSQTDRNEGSYIMPTGHVRESSSLSGGKTSVRQYQKHLRYGSSDDQRPGLLSARQQPSFKFDRGDTHERSNSGYDIFRTNSQDSRVVPNPFAANDGFPMTQVQPPNMQAVSDDATDEEVAAELGRMLSELATSLRGARHYARHLGQSLDRKNSDSTTGDDTMSRFGRKGSASEGVWMGRRA